MPAECALSRRVFAENQTAFFQDPVSKRKVIAGIRTVQPAAQYGNGFAAAVQAAAVRAGVDAAGHSADYGNTVCSQICGKISGCFLSGVGRRPAADNAQGSFSDTVSISLIKKDRGRIVCLVQFGRKTYVVKAYGSDSVLIHRFFVSVQILLRSGSRQQLIKTPGYKLLQFRIVL